MHWWVGEERIVMRLRDDLWPEGSPYLLKFSGQSKKKGGTSAYNNSSKWMMFIKSRSWDFLITVKV
jgi:hypothetical protein